MIYCSCAILTIADNTYYLDLQCDTLCSKHWQFLTPIQQGKTFHLAHPGPFYHIQLPRNLYKTTICMTVLRYCTNTILTIVNNGHFVLFAASTEGIGCCLEQWKIVMTFHLVLL